MTGRSLLNPHGLLAALAFAFCSASAPAQVRTFTTNWPVDASRAFPVWLERPTAEVHEATTTLQIPMGTAFPGRNLALTVWFDEPPDGFLRAIWVTAATETTLCQNLYEGTGLPNRRTLLLTPDQLAEPGVLTLQANGRAMPVKRIRWEWLEPTLTLAAQGASLPEVLLGEGQTPGADELLGDPYLPLEDAWKGETITAPLSDRVERIGSGSEFSAPLELVPEQARIEVWIAGLPVGTPVTLTVNGTPADTLAVELPDLADPSYRYEGSGVWRYDGWRRAVAVIPTALLRSGENSIGFVWAESGPEVIGVKDLLIQLRYPAPVPPAPAPLGPGPDFTEIEPATPQAGQ